MDGDGQGTALISDVPQFQLVTADVDGVSDDMVAAAQVHTGAMIALVPTESDAQRIAVDGGEDAEQLHVTICYLGDAALIPPEIREQLVDCISECALRLPTVVGNVFSISVFNPVVAGIGGAEPCVTALVSGSLLQRAYDVIARDTYHTLDTAGVAYPVPHSPWIPHITLLYTDDADASAFTDKMGPVSFDRVRLAFGNDVYDIPLGDGVEELMAGFNPNQPRDDDGQWTDTPGGLGTPGDSDLSSVLGPGGKITTSGDSPGAAEKSAVSALIGKNVDIVIDIGVEYTTSGKLVDVGTAASGADGVKVKTSTGEKFVLWSMLKSVTPGANNNDDVGDENAEKSPYSAAFTSIAKNAKTGNDALFAAPSLSEDAPIQQHWALGSYEAEGYAPTNAALRTGNMSLTAQQNRGDDGIIDVSVRENIRHLDRMFKNSNTRSDIISYRGVKSLKSLGVGDGDEKNGLEGLEWEDLAYTSTSTDEGRAGSFVDKRFGEGTGALLRILVPKGTHAINLGSSESEVLIDRGYRYKIVSDNGVIDGIRRLDVEVIPK